MIVVVGHLAAVAVLVAAVVVDPETFPFLSVVVVASGVEDHVVVAPDHGCFIR